MAKRKQQAGERRAIADRGHASLKAREPKPPKEKGCARLKSTERNNRLPPIGDVFGDGGEAIASTGSSSAPKITAEEANRINETYPVRSRLASAEKPKTKPAPGKIKRSKNSQLTQTEGISSDGHEPKTIPKKINLRGQKQRQVAGDCNRPAEKGVASTCQQLRELQRRKVAALKARIAIENQLTAIVAIELGYSAGLEEKDRKALWGEAGKLIKQIDEDGVGDNCHAATAGVSALVKTTMISRDGFAEYLSRIEKQMVVLAKTLPVAEWVEGVRGMGLLSLAAIVGECGDLGGYRSPFGLWKRLGLAPVTSRGKTQMPSTWRSKGGLSAEEWTEAGYSPRRRSIMYVVGECLVKQNKGEFRQRYDEAKAKAKAAHGEDWTDGHCHNHAMLLCTKRLIKRLWQAWRGQNGDILPENTANAKVPGLPASGEAVE